MKSLKPGTDTFNSSVTSISKCGFWLLCEDVEYFIAFNDYPAFKDASVDKIFNLKFLSPKQLHWPDIDIDIELDALVNPESFPLQYKK